MTRQADESSSSLTSFLVLSNFISFPSPLPPLSVPRFANSSSSSLISLIFPLPFSPAPASISLAILVLSDLTFPLRPQLYPFSSSSFHLLSLSPSSPLRSQLSSFSSSSFHLLSVSPSSPLRSQLSSFSSSSFHLLSVSPSSPLRLASRSPQLYPPFSPFSPLRLTSTRASRLLVLPNFTYFPSPLSPPLCPDLHQGLLLVRFPSPLSPPLRLTSTRASRSPQLPSLSPLPSRPDLHQVFSFSPTSPLHLHQSSRSPSALTSTRACFSFSPTSPTSPLPFLPLSALTSTRACFSFSPTSPTSPLPFLPLSALTSTRACFSFSPTPHTLPASPPLPSPHFQEAPEPHLRARASDSGRATAGHASSQDKQGELVSLCQLGTLCESVSPSRLASIVQAISVYQLVSPCRGDIIVSGSVTSFTVPAGVQSKDLRPPDSRQRPSHPPRPPIQGPQAFSNPVQPQIWPKTPIDKHHRLPE
ncbi:hypothetical protein C7M84_005446 [Penaeus vannamei]|uniref:Uncharacterized protein n=1 Tax=Penaeus vannamei TaxID=6689 RepID=A0A423THQ2_PENVA|nr:hypothetical protein C7M84_005446 [Penaeus vannamei]